MSARVSDEAFRALFEPHRRAITLHGYRMLGSLQDAEEIVQETLLRAWQRRAEVRSTSAIRAWLYKIATNACLDHLRGERRLGLSTCFGIVRQAGGYLRVESRPGAGSTFEVYLPVSEE